MFRDVLRDASGRVLADRGWKKNAIVTNCHVVLASFIRGAPATTGIAGLSVGAGLAAWDLPPGPPDPSPTQAALVDPNPFLVPPASLKIDFLNGGVVTATPTGKLQIVATLGPGVPTWPDANHATITLREFGLVATLSGAHVLLNYRTHPAIVKDPTSTLTRTIWLVF
jgi:hypothetical protein